MPHWNEPFAIALMLVLASGQAVGLERTSWRQPGPYLLE
jgi:hypothetical protein